MCDVYSHTLCLTCLSQKHAEVTFVDESYTHCGKVTIAILRSRLRYLERGGVLSVIPQSGSSAGQQRASLLSTQGNLRITVWVSPPGQSLLLYSIAGCGASGGD